MVINELEYSLDNGEIEIRESASGMKVWKGHPLVLPVIKVTGLPARQGCIALLDPMKRPRQSFANLIRCSPLGSVIWQADPPTSFNESYVEFDLSDDAIIAWSWSGYRLIVGIERGEILSKKFGK